MDSTLCLVDAQDGFWKNAGKIKNELIHALEDAFDRGDKLVILEYTRCEYGLTHPSLMKVIDCFPSRDVQFMEKHEDDGSDKAVYAIGQAGFPRHVRVCGVNRCYCVYRTATGIVEHDGFSAELVSNAVSCWDWCSCEMHGAARILDRYRINGIRIN